jgi:hypothetical protein
MMINSTKRKAEEELYDHADGAQEILPLSELQKRRTGSESYMAITPTLGQWIDKNVV